MLRSVIQQLEKIAKALPARWSTFVSSKRGRHWLRIGRIVLTLGIVSYLILELIRLDIKEVTQALPVVPGFYVLAVLVYFLLPVMQLIAYRITWEFDIGQAIGAFIKKRILNKDVLGYSGEVYIYTWAREHVNQSSRALMKMVRDMNILSAGASTGVAAVLLIFFALKGQINIQDMIGSTHVAWIIGVAVYSVIVVMVVVRLRRYLFSMPRKPATIIFGLHVARQFIRQFLEIGMWHLAMPDVPLAVWFTYAAISIVVTRIPFLPNQDLVTMGMAVGISGTLTMAEPQIFALFGSVVIIHRLISLLLFVTLPAWPRQVARQMPQTVGVH